MFSPQDLFTSKALFGKSDFITCESLPDKNVCIRFIHIFDCPLPLISKNLTLNISSSGGYAVWLNSKFIGANQCAYIENSIAYDNYSVSIIKENDNRLCVEVYDLNEPVFIFSLFYGGKFITGSDPETLCSPAPYYGGGDPPVFFWGHGSGWNGDNYQYKNVFSKCRILSKRALPVKNPICEYIYERAAPKLYRSSVFYFYDETRLAGEYENHGAQSIPVKRSCPIDCGVCFESELGAALSGYVCFTFFTQRPARVRVFADGEYIMSLESIGGEVNFTFFAKHIRACVIRLDIYSDSAILHYAGIIPTRTPFENPAVLSVGDSLHRILYNRSMDAFPAAAMDFLSRRRYKNSLEELHSLRFLLCGLYYAYGAYDLGQVFIHNLSIRLAEDYRQNGPLNLTDFHTAAVWISCLYDLMMFGNDKSFILDSLSLVKEILDSGMPSTFIDGRARLFEYCLFSLAALSAAGLFAYAGYYADSEKYRDIASSNNRIINEKFYDKIAKLYKDNDKSYAGKPYTDKSYTGKPDGKSEFSEYGQALAVSCFAYAERKLDAVERRNESARCKRRQMVDYIFSGNFSSDYKNDAYIAQKADALLSVRGDMSDAFEALSSRLTDMLYLPDVQSVITSVYMYYRHALGVFPCCSGFSGYSVGDSSCGFSVWGKIHIPGGILTVSEDKKIEKS